MTKRKFAKNIESLVLRLYQEDETGWRRGIPASEDYQKFAEYLLEKNYLLLKVEQQRNDEGNPLGLFYLTAPESPVPVIQNLLDDKKLSAYGIKLVSARKDDNEEVINENGWPIAKDCFHDYYKVRRIYPNQFSLTGTTPTNAKEEIKIQIEKIPEKKIKSIAEILKEAWDNFRLKKSKSVILYK